MEVWFKETFGDIQAAWRITEVLHHRRSPYQDVLVVNTVEFGRMLVLDDCVMTTDKDEAAYHEMLVHPALLAHPRPRSVCVVGGGDGGTIREVLRHSCVERAVLAEIDGDVIEVCQQYFPRLADCLTRDHRVQLAVGDGFKFLEENPDCFDVILSDSTDPIGPGAALFDDDYFRLAKRALKQGGSFVTQCKSLWTDVKTAREIQARMQRHFGVVLPYVSSVPTYPTGTWSFMYAAESIDPRTQFDTARQREICQSSHYYTAAHQSGAFAVPAFYFRD
ncbi:polyamine aminopropyltransferase [candidate division KSB1 bacterium]|nr:polyamine aminopropyltransferase [candidate division KSB1 bacterium]